MRYLKLLAAVVALVAVVSSQAQAQAKPWVLDAYGLYVIPSGDFGDQVKASPGAGVSLSYRLVPALLIGATGNLAPMKAKEEGGIDQRLMDFFATLGYDVAANAQQMSFILWLGAGANTNRIDLGTSTANTTSETNFAASGGAKFYFWLSPSIALLGGANATMVFHGSSDSESSSSSMYFPLNVGLGVGF